MVAFCSVSIMAEPPDISVNVLSLRTVQISCVYNGPSDGLVNIYQKHGKNTTLRVRIEETSGKCKSSSDKQSVQIACTCLGKSHVLCNISDSSRSTAGEKWSCLLFKDAKAIYSDQEDALFNVISTQAIQEWPIEHSMGINVVAENTNYITSTIDAQSRITEMREGSTAIDYTYTSSVTEYFVASNTSVTDLNGNELPGVMDQIVLKAILATAGPFIILDIALIVFVCRRKLKACLKPNKVYTDDIEIAATVSFQRSVNIGESENDAHRLQNAAYSDYPTVVGIPDSKISWDRIPCVNPVGAKNQMADDPLYSRGACGYNAQGARHEFDNILNDDPLYSSVSCRSPHHETECFSGAVCTMSKMKNRDDRDNNMSDLHCTSALRLGEVPLYSKVNKRKPSSAIKTSPDEVYSLAKETGFQYRYSTLKENPLNITDKDDYDNSHYATVNTDDDPLHLRLDTDSYLYSTVKKTKHANEIVNTTCRVAENENSPDPLYSVVKNTTNTDTAKTDSKRIVPPAHITTTTCDSPYNKVNKKKPLDSDC